MEIRRPSTVDAMPLAGAYLYTDFPGAEPVRVDVAIEFGQVLVRFPPLDGDEGAELLLKDMAAFADWKQHFQRIG
jgi:hypothetical protein